ncbi:MAG: PSD1 and planctomycete cytochrome C domain-containing protein [Verrucomicrobiales bacterium]
MRLPLPDSLRFTRVAGLAVLLPWCLEAQPEREKMDSEFFERNIRPILVKHCYECHSEEEETQKGGLLLDRESGWLEGGDSGKAVVPGQPAASLLVQAVRREDEDTAMPPKYALEPEAVELLTRWVKEDAPGPATDMGATEFSQLGDQEVIFEKASSHWAFQPVEAAEPPEVPKAAWNENPVDRFLFAKLRESRLTPSRPADKRTLVRRLSYGLSGLPPSGPEMFDLEIDELVDRLIDSPRFGEHVARMWLDVARYADTAGTYRPDTKTPHYYPYAFTYRDYVIDAFNADKSFDRFVKEQLAADLMGIEENSREIAALGFIAVSPHRIKSDDFIDDVIDATTRGFLGMTVSCSRCHDHKFEPIPTADYYSLYGVFTSIERPEPWELDEFPEIEGYEPTPEELAAYRKARAEVDAKIVEAGDKKKRGNNRSLAESIEQTSLAELLLFNDGAPVRAMTVSESDRPKTAAIFIRGERTNRGDRVPRRFLEILDPEQPSFNNQDSGRLDLAEKIASESNPLTARVFVNRVWGMLMGDYLVDTPSDFGLQGEEPSHPELLDFLAADFVRNGWSTKHLVRTIVASQAYRQSSAAAPKKAEVDPENELYWRANRRRLPIEQLRDSLLAVSGRLDLEMHGRSGPLWGEDYTTRRSIYGYLDRFNLDTTLRNFDFPSPMQTQASRTEAIVAPQALFMMNSPFVIDQAEAAVKEAGLEGRKSREEMVDALFRHIVQRPVKEAEFERISKFADLEISRNVDPWPLLAQSLLMSNEFLYID